MKPQTVTSIKIVQYHFYPEIHLTIDKPVKLCYICKADLPDYDHVYFAQRITCSKCKQQYRCIKYIPPDKKILAATGINAVFNDIQLLNTQYFFAPEMFEYMNGYFMCPLCRVGKQTTVVSYRCSGCKVSYQLNRIRDKVYYIPTLIKG